jgi:acetyl esterase/lipase
MAAEERERAEREQPGQVLPLPPAPDAIELRHLRSFVAVAEELNFGRAAARLFLSQPALSRQISALERLVGSDLLRRSTRRVELTLAGDALLDRARRLLLDVDDAIRATRSVGGELADRVARAWRPVHDLTNAGAGIHQIRAAMEEFHADLAPPPEGTVVRPVNAGGVPALAVSDAVGRTLTVLHLHGGAFVGGSAFGFRPLAGALAVATGVGVLVPEYRLAPEHPFPAAVDDAVHAYRWLLDTGVAPQRITVSGDSAGGGLVMSMLLTLAQQGVPLPAQALLLCPWLDLTCDRQPAHEPQPFLDVQQQRVFAAAYLGDHDPRDPRVSPLTADLSGLPPILVQTATGDPLTADAHRIVERACGFGVDARLEIYPAATHVFQYFWSFLPEAADALDHAGAFISRTAG